MRCSRIVLVALFSMATACSGGELTFVGGNEVASGPVTLAPPDKPTPDVAPPGAPDVSPDPEPEPKPKPSPNDESSDEASSDEGPATAPSVPCDTAWTFGATPTEADLPPPHFQLDFDNEDELFDPNNGVTLYNGQFKPLSTPSDVQLVGDFITGREGRALHLQDGYLALNPNTVFPLSPGGVPLQHGSMAFWIGTQSFHVATANDVQLIHSDDVNATGWMFSLGINDKRLKLYAEQLGEKPAKQQGKAYTAYSIFHGVSDWAAGGWHHVVVTWEKVAGQSTTAEYRLYIDGRLIDRDVSTNFPIGTKLPQHLYLLSTHRSGWNNSAKGEFAIDTFRTYDTVLTHDQIVTSYRAHLDRKGPHLNAGVLEMQFLGAKDGYGLAGIRDGTTGEEKTMRAPSRQLWALQLASAINPKIQFTLTNQSTRHADVSCMVAPETGDMTLEWRNIALPKVDNTSNADDRLHVTMTLHPDSAEREITSQLHVDNATSQWILRETEFPRFGGIGPVHGATATTTLVRTGPNIGSLRANPFENDLWRASLDNGGFSPVWDIALPYPSAEVPAPFVALIDMQQPTGGLYFGVHDPQWQIKTFIVNHLVESKGLLPFITDHGLDIAVSTTVQGSDAPGNDLASTPTAVLRLQDGSWFDVAQRYRRFLASTAQMKGVGTLRARATAGKIPAWVTNIGLIHTASGYGQTTLDTMVKEVEQQGAKPSLILWEYNLWQEASNYTMPGVDKEPPFGVDDVEQKQDNNFPFSKPANGFGKAISDAYAKGIPTTLYFLPTWWDLIYDTGKSAAIDTSAWFAQQGATMSMVKDSGTIEGNVQPNQLISAYPEASAKLARMCPRATAWQQLLIANVGKLMTHTVGPGKKITIQGFYLDEIARRLPATCYSKDHAAHQHAVADPSAYALGFREILAKLRQQTGAMLYSEGFSDPYFDVLDGNFIEYLPWFEDALVPITIAATHDYTQFFGWRTWLNSEPYATMIAKQGQLFTWGAAPGALFGTNATYGHKVQRWVIFLGRMRQQWKEYLLFGRMAAPVTVQLLEEAIGESTPKTIAPPAGKPMPLQTLAASNTDPAKTLTLPTVAASAWTTAAGKAGIVVTSLEIDGTRVVYVPIDRTALGLAGSTSKITVHGANTSWTVAPLTGPGGVRLVMPSQKAFLIAVE